MMVKDYRESHIDERKSIQYEDKIYKSGSYDDLLWGEEKKILDKEIYFFSKEIPDNIRYLDFACGTGRIIAYLENKVTESVGVDISTSMLRMARTKIRSSKLLEGDLTKKDILQGEVFDLITAFRFFLNAQDSLRKEAFDILAAKLKTDDSLLIFNIHGNIWSHRIFTKLYYFLKGRHLNTASCRNVKKLVAGSGIQIKRVYRFGILPKIFYRYFNKDLLLKIDRVLSSMPILKYMSYNMIFICTREKKLQ